MAPEVFNYNYSVACDTWSLGVILYIMLWGYPPFASDDDPGTIKWIANLDYEFDDESWDSVSTECKDLISKILVYEEQRISLENALDHIWTKNMVDDTLTICNLEYVHKFKNFMSASQLKKIILSYLASKVNDIEVKEEIEIFKAFDTNIRKIILNKCIYIIMYSI